MIADHAILRNCKFAAHCTIRVDAVPNPLATRCPIDRAGENCSTGVLDRDGCDAALLPLSVMPNRLGKRNGADQGHDPRGRGARRFLDHHRLPRAQQRSRQAHPGQHPDPGQGCGRRPGLPAEPVGAGPATAAVGHHRLRQRLDRHVTPCRDDDRRGAARRRGIRFAAAVDELRNRRRPRAAGDPRPAGPAGGRHRLRLGVPPPGEPTRPAARNARGAAGRARPPDRIGHTPCPTSSAVP